LFPTLELEIKNEMGEKETIETIAVELHLSTSLREIIIDKTPLIR
jgi:hypothetical protein